MIRWAVLDVSADAGMIRIDADLLFQYETTLRLMEARIIRDIEVLKAVLTSISKIANEGNL